VVAVALVPVLPLVPAQGAGGRDVRARGAGGPALRQQPAPVADAVVEIQPAEPGDRVRGRVQPAEADLASGAVAHPAGRAYAQRVQQPGPQVRGEGPAGDPLDDRTQRVGVGLVVGEVGARVAVRREEQESAHGLGRVPGVGGVHGLALVAAGHGGQVADPHRPAAGAGDVRRELGEVVCPDPGREAAGPRAHDEFRWFACGWKVNSELPHPDSFEAATRFVRPEDVASTIPCGDDPDDFVEAVRPYAEAGFTEIALVQVGGESQPAYLDWAEKTLL